MDDLWESEHRGLTLNTLKIYYFLSFSWFYAVFLVSPTVGLRPEKHYRRAGHSNSRSNLGRTYHHEGEPGVDRTLYP